MLITAFAVYLSLVPSVVLGGDNGEFALLSRVDGIAHPPGYPLYLGLLRVLRWIPGETPAQSAGYATVVMAGLQFLALYVAARCWRIPALAAAIAVGFYAGSPLAIHHYSHAEVFALNGLIVGMILIGAAPRVFIPPGFILIGLCLLAGLGLAHHHTFVLVSPLIAYGLLRSFLYLKCSWRWIAFGVVSLLVGFSVNLLIVEWSQGENVFLYSWGVIDSWDSFWHHFLRRDYGTLDLASSSVGEQVSFGTQLLRLILAMLAAWKILFVFACIGLLGRVWRFKRKLSWAWIALILSWLAAGPLFFSRANIDPSAGITNWEVLERFYLLPSLLLLIPVGEGLRLSYSFISRRLRLVAVKEVGLNRFAKCSVFAVLPIYAFGFNAFLSYRETSVRRGAFVQDHLISSMAILPPDSVVIVRSDDEMYAASYLQAVLGHRKDLLLLNTSFLARSWFTERLRKRLPGCRWPAIKVKDFIPYISRKCGKDVFVNVSYLDTEDGRRLLREYPSYQFGPYRRVLTAPNEVLPDSETMFNLNRRLFADFFSAKDRQLSMAHGWASRPAQIYRLSWLAIAADLDRAKRFDLAREARGLAIRYGPCLKGDCLVR